MLSSFCRNLKPRFAICLSKKNIFSPVNKTFKRTFLSSSYPQNEKWNSRLNHPIFKVSSASELGTEITYNLDDEKDVSMIDYDAYLNKIGELNMTDLDFVEAIIQRYNKTMGVLQRFDALSHAVIRSYIDFHEEHRLIELLKKKREYGIFLDEISTNLLMNSFILQNDWSAAVLVAYERMLQEEIEKPSTLLMMMETCRNYWALRRSSGFDKSDEVITDEDDVDYVRVKYVQNPSYDDHFDVTKDRLLLGKTFLHMGRMLDKDVSFQNSKSHLIINYNLLGLALFEKYEQLVSYMKGLLDTPESTGICPDTMNDISQLMDWTEVLPDGETVKRGEMLRYPSQDLEGLKSSCQALLNEFKSKNLILDKSLDSLSETFVNESKSRVLSDEEAYVSQVYDQWIQNRSERIQRENEREEKEESLRFVKGKLRELLDREEKAHFFDKNKEIDYAAWLAPRTFKEKRSSRRERWRENIQSIESQKKRRIAILETPEEN